MSRGNQPRLAASRMFRWLRFSEWYHGCDAAAVSDMLTLRCSQVKRKRRPVLLATCMDDLVQVSAEDGLSGHNKGRPGRSARRQNPRAQKSCHSRLEDVFYRRLSQSPRGDPWTRSASCKAVAGL